MKLTVVANRIASLIAERQKKLAPRRTGALAGSIKTLVEESKDKITISTSMVDYGWDQDSGVQGVKKRITEELYNEILVEIKKERIKNMANITPEKMRLILRKIKYNDYYEHIPYIINQLNGLEPPIISGEVEEIIRNMFKEIQVPFEELRHKVVPKRKNFLSYNYIMYKFFELLELDEYLKCFMLLKSRNKLHQQDIIWKQICNYLNWQYIPSI